MSGSSRSGSCPATGSWTGAQWVGDPGRGGVLLLSAGMVSGGRWCYTYSVRPGVQVAIITEAGPDSIAPTDPIYLEVINGNAPAARPDP